MTIQSKSPEEIKIRQSLVQDLPDRTRQCEEHQSKNQLNMSSDHMVPLIPMIRIPKLTNLGIDQDW